MRRRIKKRPLIGVTGPDRGGFPAWMFTAIAIVRAGGWPTRLRPGKYPIDESLPPIDGLVLGGGADVDPGLYGGEIMTFMDKAIPPAGKRSLSRVASWLLAPVLYIMRRFFSLSAGGVDHARDDFEERCVRNALEAGLPILGICRGAQFINVHFGGTLHGDLTDFYSERGRLDGVYPRKRVTIADGSRLGRILGRNQARVNSLHKQAVNRLGEGMRVSALDDAGVVQAVEHTTHPLVVGVQWHPEYLPFLRTQGRLFRALVARAGRIGG